MSRLDDQLKAIRESQKKGRPSLNTRPRSEPRAEEPVLDVRELGLEPEHATTLLRLAAQHVEQGSIARAAGKQRDLVSDQIKTLCNDYGLRKAMADDLLLNYYPLVRKSIDAGMLLAAGVSAATIAKCTVETTSWALRVTAPGMREED